MKKHLYSDQSGRSLIELIGVIAIGGVMTAAAIATYSTLRTNQTRTIALAEIRELVRNVKILMEPRGTYDGVSVSYLIKAGALSNNAAPIGDASWSVVPTTDGAGFAINLNGLSNGECVYMVASAASIPARVNVNGFTDGNDDNCFSSATNQVSLVIE